MKSQSDRNHKILLVCDSTCNRYSGGKVARYICKLLEGNTIKIVVTAPRSDDVDLDSFYRNNDVTFISQRDVKRFTIGNALFLTKGLQEFTSLLQEFKPEIVHFVSFDNVKPAAFILESKKIGARVIIQPFDMDFFCACKYGYRNNEQCSLCVKGAFWHSITKKCMPLKHLFSIRKRKQNKKEAIFADVVLSSNEDMDDLLSRYGIKKNNIFRFPIPFDCSSHNVIIQSPNELDYCICYCLPTSAKGFDGLLSSFSNDPFEKIKIFPSLPVELDEELSSNIELVSNASWGNGLRDAIISAYAVIVPSLWATTGEYALYEAMLYRKTVIAFNVGVHKNLLQNDENAIIVEPGDFRALIKAVTRVRKDHELRKRLTENAFNTLLAINDPISLKEKLFRAYFG